MRHLALLCCVAVCGIAIPASQSQAVTLAYKYDGLGRLTRIDYPFGKYITYTYDAAGNRTQKVVYAPTNLAPTPNIDYVVTDGMIEGSWPESYYWAFTCWNPLTNDTDPENNTITLSGVYSLNYNQYVSIEGNEICFAYDDQDDQLEEISGQYLINDGHGNSVWGNFYVTINW